MNWQRIKAKLQAGPLILKGKINPSYAQAGEDQVIRYLINDCLQLYHPSYLDIGTNHPVFGNNTYYFYTRGSKGVCIEPNPYFTRMIRKFRPNDIFIQAGVGTGEARSGVFFCFPSKYGGWNTFSEEEALKRKEETGIPFTAINDIPLVTVNEIISKHFSPWPNIISLDVEGMDFEILKNIDFDKYKPEIICVESITFSNTNQQNKIMDIPEFAKSKGYFVFADTYVNTIFCRSDAFKKINR